MSEKKKKVDTAPYKGVRDFYPEEMYSQKYIFEVMRRIVEKYGFEEYRTSVLEPEELYIGKSSEEITSEQTYSFEDRGGRRVTLRPEMTPSVARLIAAKNHDLRFPLRWYSIADVFRYERPQKGRLREHFQLNADLFGDKSLEADIEIVRLAQNILLEFGAKENDFVIKINNRGHVADAVKKYLREESALPLALKLLDKREKIGEETFREEWKKFSDKELSLIPTSDLETLLSKLKELGVNNAFIDPYLVRGFDYYTGTVFEVFDSNTENKRSIFGGGRYDNLLSLFGADQVPAVGFGLGDVTLREFLESRNLLPRYVSKTDLYVCYLPQIDLTKGTILTDIFRKTGLNVAEDRSGKKIGDQIKTADKHGIQFVVCIGENEINTGVVKIKRLKDGVEKEIKAEHAISFIKQ
jgi:histidyl-tRNA synthetase